MRNHKFPLLVLFTLISTATFAQSPFKVELVKITGIENEYKQIIKDKEIGPIANGQAIYEDEYFMIKIKGTHLTAEDKEYKYLTIFDIQTGGVIQQLFPNPLINFEDYNMDVNLSENTIISEFWENHIITMVPPFGKESFLALFSKEPLEFSENPLRANYRNLTNSDIIWLLEGNPPEVLKDVYTFRLDFEIRSKTDKINDQILSNRIEVSKNSRAGDDLYDNLHRNEVPPTELERYPLLIMTSPAEPENLKRAKVGGTSSNIKSYVVKGNVSPKNTVNTIEVSVFSELGESQTYIIKSFQDAGQSKSFEKEIVLYDGANKLKIRVINQNGKSVYDTFLVEYKKENTIEEPGKDWLILLAGNEYSEWPKLKTPISDANEIANILQKNYGFTSSNTVKLFENQYTLRSVDSLFRDLINRLKPNDRIVVYYAGHGYNDSVEGGFWVPVNGHLNNTDNYISNYKIAKYIKSLKTKHTLFIADACFSGTFYASQSRGKDNYASKISNMQSRWLFSSGRNEEVSDVLDGTNHSPFAYYILKYLSNPQEHDFTISELAAYVTRAVANNSDQIPMARPIQNAGDEGGEFVFRYR